MGSKEVKLSAVNIQMPHVVMMVPAVHMGALVASVMEEKPPVKVNANLRPDF